MNAKQHEQLNRIQPRSPEPAAGRNDGPVRTPAGRLNEILARWISDSVRGESFGRWMSKTIALPQLKRLASAEPAWAPFRRPLSECTIVLISTAGVHLRSDRPFHLNSDPTFRTIPKNALPADLAISHQAYDRTDALRDINLVFPIERLRELETERVIGRLTEEQYSFGLEGSARRLMPTIKDVALRIKEAKADLVLLVPA
jgi:D-proline reductase (dithiol) PrdB